MVPSQAKYIALLRAERIALSQPIAPSRKSFFKIDFEGILSARLHDKSFWHGTLNS